jgi:hypothetical protein
MPGNLLYPKLYANKVSVTAAAATASSAAFSVGNADCYQFVLNVTAATGRLRRWML